MRNYSIRLVNHAGLSACLIYTPATSFKFLMGLQRFNEAALNPYSQVQIASPVRALISSKNTLHIPKKKDPCTVTELRRKMQGEFEGSFIKSRKWLQVLKYFLKKRQPLPSLLKYGMQLR